MQWIIFIAVVVTAAVIFLEDFLFRSVHGLLFLLLAVLGAAMQLRHTPVTEFVLNSSINIIMLALHIAITIGIMWMNGRKVLWKMIGPGDLLLMLACCLLFAPFSFLFFMITSLVMSLLLHIFFIHNKLYKKNGGTVALAGWQSLTLIIFICTAVTSGMELYADEWILKFIMYDY